MLLTGCTVVVEARAFPRTLKLLRALTACRAVPTINKGAANDKGKGESCRGVKRKFIVEVAPIGAAMEEWYEDYLIGIEVAPIGAAMEEWYEDYLIGIDPS